jgi:hypothetical protein
MLPIVVNSTKKYANTTLPLLLESFEKYKKEYNPEIIIIIGGYDAVTVRKLNSYTIIEVDNNTIDFTGLLYILENDILKQEHFLYIHDTIVVGETFFIRHANLPSIPTNTTVSFQFPSSFIGIYSKNVLQKFKDELIALKNKDYRETTIQKIKHQCVISEDYIFRLNISNHIFFPTKPDPKWGTTVTIYNGVPRLPEYYADLDFYKYKATWARSDDLKYNLVP